MKEYLDIAKNCLENGTPSDNRTSIKTIRIPWGATFQHDMSNGFPLLTTKKMGLKNISTELEFFINGFTDKKWLQDRNCHIWDEWATIKKWEPIYDNALKVVSDSNEINITPEFKQSLQNTITNATRDLGPIYGWQWRHFGGEYKWNPDYPNLNYNVAETAAYGKDQLANVIETAKKDPNNRRLIVSAWNPKDQWQMALPPCHIMHQILIHDGKIHLIWTQRSCDIFLGVPYNIASYAMLLLLYAKELGYKPGILRGELHDVHIYENHIDQVKEQLSRTPYKLPTVEIPDENWNGMLKWHADGGFKLKDYICHAAIKGAVAR